MTAHTVYTGSFSDDSLMATQAPSTFAERPADVLTGSSQSVRRRDQRRKVRQLAWFGTQWTQTTARAEEVVSSQVYNWVPRPDQDLQRRSGRASSAGQPM